MAASEESCDGNPNFAIICSFISKFGDDCGVNISIPYLQQMLEDTKNVSEDLQELLIHLLRRGRKRVNKERWEKCLIKFCHEYSSVDAWEIERFGFTKAKISVKLEILKRLLELQFDANAKFKAEVNKLEASSLRLLPLGKDIDGQGYWYQLDKEYNIRLYRESIGDDGAWQLLCSNTEDLRNLLITLEKKNPGSGKDSCEDKSNDSNNPKSPTSDVLPVPKKECDTEVTSHLSESKPCTIIIKTEKREAVSHSEVPSCVKNENCAIETDKKAIGCELENSTKGSVKLKLKLEPSVHSRTEHKSSDRAVVECRTVIEKPSVVVLDAEPMETETSKATSSDGDTQLKSVPVNDVEMVAVENVSVNKVRSESKREEQTDQNFSTNDNSSVAVEHSDSVNHHSKSSKIKLYEKWSSEKKKLDTSKHNIEECNIDSETSSVVEEKDQSVSVTLNQKHDPAIPPKCPSEQSSSTEVVNKQSDLTEPNRTPELETAVDLSKASRVNVIVQNVCSKPILSNGMSSVLISNSEKSENDSKSSNLETIKKSDSSSVSLEKSQERTFEQKHKSFDSESNDVRKRNQKYSECYDASVITKTSSVLGGFSHLQALQNMCESNQMGGIPSVIQSANRHNIESNRTAFFENKIPVNSDSRFENISRRYNFNDVHCSGDKIIPSGSEATNMMLKSNVYKRDDERDKKMELKSPDYQDKSISPNFNVVVKEQESFQETPTDLSCSDHKKFDNCDSKFSENKNKTSSSATNKSDTSVRDKVGVDVTEKESRKSAEKAFGLSKRNNISKNDSMENEPENLCNLSDTNSLLDSSVKDKETTSDEAKELCHKKAVVNSSESAIKSSNIVFDSSYKHTDPEKLQEDKLEKSVSIVEPLKHTNKNADFSDVSKPVTKSIKSCSSLDKFKDENIISVKGQTDSSKDVLKDSVDGQLNRMGGPINEKSKFVNDAPSLLEANSSIKVCTETLEKSEKEEKNVLLKSSGVLKNDVKKEQEVLNYKLPSKSIELTSLEKNKSSGQITPEPEKNKHCKKALHGDENRTTKSNEGELDLTVNKEIAKDKSHRESFNVSSKGQSSELSTNSSKASIRGDTENAHEKKNNRMTEKEMDIDITSEGKMDTDKMPESKMKLGKEPDCKTIAQKTSESEMDIEEIHENRLITDNESKNKKIFKSASDNEIDMEQVSESKTIVEKVFEKKINNEKTLENVIESKENTIKDNKKIAETKESSRKEHDKITETKESSRKEHESIAESKEDSKKVDVKIAQSKEDSKKDDAKLDERKKDSEKDDEQIAGNRKDCKDDEKVAQTKKGSKKDDVKITESRKDAKKDYVKITESRKDAKKDDEKIAENNKNIKKDDVKMAESKKESKKVSENETAVEEVSESKKDSKKVSENEIVEEVVESKKDVKKVLEKDSEDKKDSEEVSRNDIEAGKKQKHKKDAVNSLEKERNAVDVSKSKKEEIRASENEGASTNKNKTIEVTPENKKNEDVMSEQDMNKAKVTKQENPKVFATEEIEDKVSHQVKNVENVASKSEEKVVGEPNKKNEVKTQFENKKGGEKISIKGKNVEKITEKEKDVEKVTKKEKEVENLTAKEKGKEKVSKNETSSEKESKEKMNIEKISNKEVEKESKETINIEKVSKKDNLERKNKKDSEKVCNSETDLEKRDGNKAVEKVSKEHKKAEKEPENHKNVIKVTDNKKSHSEASDSEIDAKKINKKEKCIEKVSKEQSTRNVEQSKSKLSLDNSKTFEEINKGCLLEENSIESKSDKNESNKVKCNEREYDDKNTKPSSSDDAIVKLKSQPSNEIKEKPMEIETDFTNEDDKVCSSKIECEEKLCKEDLNSEKASKMDLQECLENKNAETNESSTHVKDIEMSDNCTSSKADTTTNAETGKKPDIEGNSLNKVKDQTVPKPRKGRRKTVFTRKKIRGKKDYSLEVPDVKPDSETILSTKGEELLVGASIEESSVISSKTDTGRTVLKSNVSYDELFKVYNLRHSTCLEAKFKHPLCNKYLRRTGELKSHVLSECTIELTNDENLLTNLNEVSPANTKTRSRGKKSKPQVNKKPEPESTPVAKAVPPPKKTPASNSKKRQNRNRRKEDSEKDDFAIPEGFLEILGNTEKGVSDKGVPRKKRKGFEMKDTSPQNSDNESTPIKRSRRIQEQHQKKMTELAVEMEREQRILEQLAKRSNSAKKNVKSGTQKSPVKGSSAKINAKDSSTPTKSPKARAKIQAIATEEETCMESRRTTRKMNSRSKNLTKMTLLYEDESKDSQFSTSRETEKSKRRRRGRGQKKGFKPWDVSSESESSIEELTEEEEEEEPEEPLIFDVNEDEFACEEVDPNAEPVVIRRARTAKKTEIESAAEECINDDTPCQKCGKYDKPEWILLCDKCDNGYHTHCLIPPLMIVPDGDWFCQPCEHMFLCQCLQEELNKLEVILKQREREELRKQRLAYVGISLDNVLKPEKKEKSDESEKEDEEEEEGEEKEDHRPARVKQSQSFDDERQQKLYGKRSVRARRNVNYQFKEYDALIASALQEEMIEMPEEEFKEEEDGSEAGSDKPFTAKISKRKKRSRRWKDLDFSDEDEDSEDDYQGGSTDSEATQPPSSNSDQESGSGEWKISKSSKKKSQRKPPRSRRRKRGGDSSEEDWEDELENEDTYRPTTRRAAQKAVSYRELSSEEEDEWGSKPQPIKKRSRNASSSDSEASFKKKPSKKKRICKWASSDSSESEEEKSMSSSEEESEEEGSQEEDNSEKPWKIDLKEKIMRLKSNTNKKVLSSEEDEESSTQDSAPKKQPRKVISDESEEEDDDEEEDDEEEDEEESESDENSEDESEEKDEDDSREKKSEKKSVVPEKKVPSDPSSKNTLISNSKSDSEKKVIPIPSEKTDSFHGKMPSMEKHDSLSITENRDFQPKVLVKKELCSVDIPLEPIKQAVPVTSVIDKAPPKTVRKDTTKMVPCVIPYDKSPKSGHASNPEEESDKETSKEEEMPHRVPPPPPPQQPPSQPRPAHFPKQGTTFPSPSSRIQFGGVLTRHTVSPLSSAVRLPVPSSNIPPRMLGPTNLSTRPSTSPSVVRHTASPSNLSVRPSIPPSNVPVSPSTSSPAAPATKNVHSKSENKSYKSTIMEPFSNMDEENESDDEVPLERIPNAVPAPLPTRPVSFEREAEYRPAAKELSTYSYAPPEEKPFPATYSPLAPFQEFSARPSPLKPSLVETYPNNSSPSKLTPLDTYSQTSSPKGFISLDSYSENRKKKHFYGNTPSEAEPSSTRPPPSSSENYQGGEIRFPPEPYPCPQSPTTYPNRSPSPAAQRDPGTPPRLYSQFPDAYAPPRSPEYYQNHQYYASEERIPRPSYQPNYAPQEPSFVSNPYVATPVPQPNGGFMIDTLLRARNHENEEDELTDVTDIVSYITQE